MSIGERIRIWRVASLYRTISRLKIAVIEADVEGKWRRAHRLSQKALKLAERGRRLSGDRR